MSFSDKERNALLEQKYIGPKVIERLEDIGIDSFEKLADYDADEIINLVSKKFKSTCWKNSPQAKKAIENAIKLTL